jgi:hypothetical protein
MGLDGAVTLSLGGCAARRVRHLVASGLCGLRIASSLRATPRVVRVVLALWRMWRSWKRGAAFVGVSVLALTTPRAAKGEECPNLRLSVNADAPRFVGSGDTPANQVRLRPYDLDPDWIDQEDCEDDVRLQFTLHASGLPCADTIQVWAGTTDCTQVSAREAGSGATRCWPVVLTGEFAMTQTSTGDIRAQDIVAFIGSPEPPTSYSRKGPVACQALRDETGSQCRVPLVLYFMAIEADGLTVDGPHGTSPTWSYGPAWSLGAELTPGGSCSVPSGEGGFPGSDSASDAGRGAGDAGAGMTVIRGCSMATGRSPNTAVLGLIGMCVLVLGGRRRTVRGAG